MHELKPQNLLAMEFLLRDNQKIVLVQSSITEIIDIYVRDVSGLLYGRHQSEKKVYDRA
jgi:uncharacterized protein YjiK